MAEAVRLQLLGGFSASAGERTVASSAWRLRKAKTLVKLLALEPGHALHRDQVIDALWPDLAAEAGRNNLNQVVHAARRALSTLGVDGGAVITVRDDLLVLGDGVAVVTDVEELTADVGSASASADGTTAARLLREAPNQLLPEDVYEPWLQAAAVAFREWRTKAAMDIALGQMSAGSADEAVVLVSTLVAADPLHEPATRLLMQALAASGRRSEALLVFERLRTALRDELAADPEEETRQLFRGLLAGGGTARSADTSAPAVTVPAQRAADNLPARVTALIGRARELEETAAILDRGRLLTLTGLGGAGKTALGIELARRCGPARGGAVLVELATLTDSDQVVPTIAKALQLDLPPDAPPIESVVAQLRQRRLLLVLDNCEHQLDVCAHVVTALLHGCPQLSVLATSREPLRIEGEVAWRTPSLELPDPNAFGTLDELASVASVALFVERATAAIGSFRLSAANATAVADICYRLDGIPLAVELAAACIPMLSPQQIVDRLGNALDLLRRGDRAGITRQQTLVATLAWSHDLLDADEQTLFRRLAVFAGSFTLDAVEAVCGEGLKPVAVLSGLARLVDTSLVNADARSDTTRYRLLETVRQFAQEQLRTAGEQMRVQQLQAVFFLQFAQDRNPERAPTAARVVPTSLDVEHDNLRAALRWAVQHDGVTALALAVALWRFWLARGLFVEGCGWLEVALAAAPDDSPSRAEGLVALAVFDVRRGRGERLRELGSEAVQIHRRHGAREGLAHALHSDAVLAFMCGEWDECLRRVHESREVAHAAGAVQLDVAATHLEAVVLLGQHRLAQARARFLAVREALGTVAVDVPPFLPPVLLGFAVEGAATAHPRIYFEETVLLGRRAGVEQAHGYVLCNLADAARLADDLDGAVTLAHEALEHFRGIGDRDGEALALNRLGCIHRTRGDYAEARGALTEALWLRRVIGDRRAIGLAQSNLGVLTAREGDMDAGCALIERALDASRDISDEPARVGLTLTLGSVYAQAGAYEAAERALRAAAPQSPQLPGYARGTAWGRVVLADVLAQLGEHDGARAAMRDAQVMFAAIGAVDPTGSLRVRRPATRR